MPEGHAELLLRGAREGNRTLDVDYEYIPTVRSDLHLAKDGAGEPQLRLPVLTTNDELRLRKLRDRRCGLGAGVARLVPNSLSNEFAAQTHDPPQRPQRADLHQNRR